MPVGTYNQKAHVFAYKDGRNMPAIRVFSNANLTINIQAICDHMGRFPDMLSGNPDSIIALWWKQPFLAQAVW